MPLSDVEVRVLGALMEKERTTPEGYPLSSQALVTACNQRTNREPVTDYHLQEVLGAVNRLRDRGLAETIQEVGDRVPKHKNKAARALELDARQFAVMAVLLLRGEQTPGELRARTDRYVEFASVTAVEETLTALSSRSASLVRSLGRAPGQSQDRWTHTLGADEEKMVPRVRPRPGGEGTVSVAVASRPETSTRQVGDAVTREEYESLVLRLEALDKRVKLLEAGD
ncbi:MAG TPA: YceH family protein [Trueperaceae bacterium]|nr:YceH family protein [Trueperaceae bacterium]